MRDLHMTGRSLGRLPLGTVYFIACTGTGRLKIGYTGGKVDKRLRALQTGSPAKLMLVAAKPGTRDDEAALHAHFAGNCAHGEWFEMTEELFEYVCQTVWIASSLAVERDWPVEPWMRHGLSMIQEHTDAPLPDHLQALIAC